MALRKMHRAHRHTGRMVQDSSMRMSNKAEVALGLAGVAFIGLFWLIVFATIVAIIF